MTAPALPGFDSLTPERILDELETAFDAPFSGVLLPLPSYINRVYEVQRADGERFIVKFYRPGRWSRGALLEEHRFTLDCRDDEIPVVPPLDFPGGGTLRTTGNGIHFAAFRKRRGRPLEPAGDEWWRRLGALLARLHLTGERRRARFRLRLDPRQSTVRDVDRLLDSGRIGAAVYRDFEAAALDLRDLVIDRYEPAEAIRLHGDCHSGNILFRPDDGLMLIDFDDMAVGPAAQDLWLLLPGYAPDCPRELELLLEGYRQLRDFPAREIARIELLRAMRMLYFLEWCCRQCGDFNFADRFPGWGGDAFWRNETRELRRQFRLIRSQPF